MNSDAIPLAPGRPTPEDVVTSWLSDMPISMETFVSLSPLFGYKLVDRSAIRKGQDPVLFEQLGCFIPGNHLAKSIENEFFYGCVDWMMNRDENGKPVFYVVEVNGSNAAGLTDVPFAAFRKIAVSIASALDKADVPRPSVIISSYTGEKNVNVHERAALAEAVRALRPDINFAYATPVDLNMDSFSFAEDSVTTVIGPINAILEHLSVQNGRLHIRNCPVVMLINDLTVDRILKAVPGFAQCLDRTLILNRTHPLVNFKAKTYDLLCNTIVPEMSQRYPIQAFSYWEAHDRETLLSLSRKLVCEEGRSIVVKPYSSSVGIGIQFLHAGITQDEVDQLVTSSMTESEDRYKGTSEIFPYTLCEFVETALCGFPDLGLLNRKFDLRFFVVKQEDGLFVIPGVVKLASEEYNSNSFYREGLQTNTMRVTQGKDIQANQIFGTLIQPLNSMKTLNALGLSVEDVRLVSEMSAKVVGYLVAEV